MRMFGNLGWGVKEQFMGKNKYLDITREGKKEAKSYDAPTNMCPSFPYILFLLSQQHSKVGIIIHIL